MKKTALAALGFMIMLGLVLLIWSRPQKGERRGAAPRPVPRFKPRAIQRVEIKTPKLSLKARRSPTGWRLQQPVDAEANPVHFEAMLARVGSMELRGIISQRQDRQASLGVDAKGGIQITLWNDSGTKMSFLVGKARPEATMIRAAGSRAIYQAQGSFRHLFIRPLRAWRQQTILRLKERQLRSIAIIAPPTGETRAVLARSPEKGWEVQLATPPIASLDKDTIERLLKSLERLVAYDFADDAKAAAVGLSPPSWRVELTLTDSSVRSLEVGERHPPSGCRYLRRAGTKQIVLVKERALKPLLLLPRELQQRGIFSFSPQDVKALSFRYPDQMLRLTRRGGAWFNARGTRIKVARAIETTVKAASALRADGFARRTPRELGLQPLRRSLQLDLGEQKLQLEIGTRPVKGMLGVRVTGQQLIYLLHQATIDRLMLNPEHYR